METSRDKSDAGFLKYSVVVPVYNSETTLKEFYERLVKVMRTTGESFEIIFVEDCGQDNSWQILCDLGERDNRVSAIQLMHNHGQAKATLCGMSHATGEYVITIDDDLQHPPEEIPVLIAKLKEKPNLDVVIGVPYEKKHAFWRNLGSRFVNLISSYALKKSRKLKFSGFRIISRQVVDILVRQNAPQPALGSLLVSITPRIENVYFRHAPREHGRSGYTIAKMLSLTLSNFMAFSVFPLRFLAIAGIVGVFISAVVWVIYLVRYITGGIKMPGFATVVLLLVGMGGFIFFAFGLVGEYLLRILKSVHFAPRFIIRQTINISDKDITGKR